MGRWKPPQPNASPYITPDGYQALQDELKDLWKRRAEVVTALAAAAAEGDRSENAEYIYRKKELGGIDYRIRYLQKRLPNLNVVRQTPTHEKIFFGAWVALEKTDGDQVEYRIVGADEANAANDTISIDSPLAQALLKKEVDDEINLTTEQRAERLVIRRIRYK
jgi:transcription elongation factor GreB